MIPAENSHSDQEASSSTAAPNNEYTFEQFENQQRQIEQEMKKFPLIDPVPSKLTLETLAYNVEDKNIQDKIERSYLLKKYGSIRGIRGDGNCFIRAFAFGLLEHLLCTKNTELANQLIGKLEEKYKILIDVFGYPDYCLEDFYLAAKQAFVDVRDGKFASAADLAKSYFSDETPDEMMAAEALICYLRFFLSAHIQQNSDDYLPFFLDQYENAKDFCSREIEVMGQESDNLHVSAMAQAFGVCLRIEVLDAQNRAADKFDIFGYTFPDNAIGTPVTYLLFRPGHYEIIYPVPENN